MLNPNESSVCVNPAEDRKKEKVTILDAKYYKEECYLVVNVLTAAGEKRSCTIPSSNKYKGKTVGEAEAHRQMGILADMFNKSRGRNIFMVADEEQIPSSKDRI